jgi:hypothetical protein
MDWVRNSTDYTVDYSKTLVIAMDTWNDVSNFDSKIASLNNFLTSVRNQGGIVCFSPYGAEKIYENHVCRNRVKAAISTTAITMPSYTNLKNVERLVKVPKGQGKTTDGSPWKIFGSILSIPSSSSTDFSINTAITINESNDIIAWSIKDILTYFQSIGREIETVFFCGKHLNWCILNRPVGMEEWKRYGFNNLIVKSDSVVATNDPKSPPYASQEEMNELHLRYIESYWGYTTS